MIIYIARVSARQFAYQPKSGRRNAATGALHLAYRMLLTDVSRSEFEQLFLDERLPGNAPGQLYDCEALLAADGAAG